MSKQAKIISALAALILVGLLLYFMLKRQKNTPTITAPVETGNVTDPSNGLAGGKTPSQALRTIYGGASSGASSQLPGYPIGTVAVAPQAYTGSRDQIYSAPVVPEPIIYSPPATSGVSAAPDAGNTSLNAPTQTGSR